MPSELLSTKVKKNCFLAKLPHDWRLPVDRLVSDAVVLRRSNLRLIDSSITQLKAQGPSMTCNESKEGEKSV